MTPEGKVKAKVVRVLKELGVYSYAANWWVRTFWRT